MIMVLLTSTTLFLISQNLDDAPNLTSLEKHSAELAQINELSKKYQSIDDAQKFNASKSLMQDKLEKISTNYLGLKISHIELLEGYYPFQPASSWAERFDLDPSSVCDFEGTIPLHLQTISKTENFKLFTKKYSPYSLELAIQDERSNISNIHYGLIATNDKNQSASTYFHLSSCTNEITDKEPYFLHCYDGNNDYRFATHNHDDIISSYSNGEFCKIELDSWRQSIFDYSKTLHEKRRQLEKELTENVVDPESQLKFISEMEIQGDLDGIVWSMIHGKFDEQSTQDKIKQYEKQYSSLPDELLELIEEKIVTGSYDLENPLCIGGRGIIKNENCERIGKYNLTTGLPIVENKEQCDMLDGNWNEQEKICDSKYDGK